MTDEGLAVGAAIRRLREQAGVTQSQLAAALGTDQSGVSKLEKGRPQATLTQLRVIEDHLELHRGAILRAAGLVEEEPTDPFTGKWVRLDERGRRVVDRVMDELLEE